MCVTTEVQGKVHFKGDRLDALRRSLINPGDGGQRLPRERQNVTYVSRLQAMQGAVEQQLGILRFVLVCYVSAGGGACHRLADPCCYTRTHSVSTHSELRPPFSCTALSSSGWLRPVLL